MLVKFIKSVYCHGLLHITRLYAQIREQESLLSLHLELFMLDSIKDITLLKLSTSVLLTG